MAWPPKWDTPHFKSGIVKGICRNCGKPCVSKDSRTYCSRACRFAVVTRTAQERRAREAKPCAHCGTPLQPKSRGRVMGKRYCSRQCERAARTARSLARRSTRTCPLCRAVFTPKWMGRAWQRYCSQACHREAQNGFVTVNCATCRAEIKKRKQDVRRSKAQFCSVGCMRAFHRGANHPHFRPEAIGDPKRRAGRGAWMRRSREARARDGHACRRCGVKHEGGRQFPVDHIMPWRLFADKAVADDLSNLATLCHSCHSWKTSVVEKEMLMGNMVGFQQYLQAIEDHR